ncbi:LLM class flavin-dependent oxidoreductase [Nonomuraea roseoviolacea]|uniref:Alkanesulfonate monooxygenase SsuD/methylene tetrahydromethanopterin reductase-like flavin-dependent oxidoreductase (Luciferase family) n=1 Tax=Nonomuraea roseoviolacea subsp. carminata TaxID=160689 RepID=A0ABT1K0D4_9ACTN|nr:LLM class flavin-dependent oxidoreductase [Nonomuraea roseoviolacea]MCP2347461.1 alkanesulfonate monooxygenase SsuD/methylene tetrahydromethanopterin reductase-like flavin-dependent oxidoreductase (luciferase family) [Nonomuraea roseoviolacea subsp. carminata]
MGGPGGVRDRLERFERGFGESLDVLVRALSGGRVSAEGEFFRFREVDLVPAATLRPVVACTSEATLELAARRGLPMLLGMHVDDREKAAAVAAYDGLCPETLCPERDGHVAAAVGHVADSTRQAVRELKEAMPRWLEPGLAGYVPVDGRRRPARDVPAYVDFLTRVHPVGSAERCVEAILATAEATGVRRIVLMVEGIGDHRRAVDNVRRLGAEVLPRVRAAAL